MRTFLLTLALGAMALPGAFAQMSPTAPGKAGVGAATTPRGATGATRTYNELHRGNISSPANRTVNRGTGSATGSANRMATGTARSTTGTPNMMRHPAGVHPKGK